MAQELHRFLMHEFGLPLGLIVVDTISNRRRLHEGGRRQRF